MKRLIVAAVAATLAGTALAAAQGAFRSDGRYIVSEVEDGILRVDRRSGQVSVCRERRGDWQCSLVPDDREALESELIQLRKENRRLRRRLADVDPGVGQRYGYAQPRDDYDDMGEGGVMSKQEVDEAMDTLEYMMDRFMGAAERLRDPNAPVQR